MNKRAQRHELIRKIVRGSQLRTQRELAARLQSAGHDCTQATISRDIAEIGLVKSRGGYYVLPEDLRLQRMVRELVQDIYAAGNLVVVKTSSGGAPGVAGAIDSAGSFGSLGTVAGDNTILVIAHTPEEAQSVGDELEGMRGA